VETPKRIVKNTISLLSAMVVRKFLGVIAIAYLARMLGPSDFGILNFAFAIISYFMLVTVMGLDTLGIREIARNRDKTENCVGNILVLRFCLGLLAFGLLFLFVSIVDKPAQVEYLILLYGLSLIPYIMLLEWVFQGVEKMEYIFVSSTIQTIVYVGLIFLFVISPGQLLYVPLILVFANICEAGFLIFIFTKQIGKLRPRFHFPTWTVFIRQALPIGISGFMIAIIYNADMVMLGFMRTNEEVGYYSAAYKIIWFIMGVFVAYFNSIFPVTAHYYKQSLEALKNFIEYSSKLVITIALPLAVGGTMLAKPIMNLIYGGKYDDGVIAFQILLWVLVVLCLNSIYARGLWACDRQKRYMAITAVQATSNIALNLLLIPLFGIVGACIATISAEIIGFYPYYREFNKIVRVTILGYVGKPLIASILMGISIWSMLNGFDLNLLLLIPVGALLYTSFLYVLGGITSEEVRLVQGIVLKRVKN
jgi:O-antigen/teichoic acid export membrane protein